jgi:hypothetical protein
MGHEKKEGESDSRGEQALNQFSTRLNLFDHRKSECTEENFTPDVTTLPLVQRYLRADGYESGFNKDLNGSPASPWAIICIGSRFGWAANGDHLLPTWT